jgi:beta-lactam-binding protein with PASTA domain
MLLRDKRLWWGLIAAVILAFVSYAVVTDISHGGPGANVSDNATITSTPAGDDTASATPTGPPPPLPGEATVPAVIGERLSQAKAQLTLAGLTNIKAVDATPQNRIILDDNNWIVEVQSPAADTNVDLHTQIVLQARKPTDEHSPQAAPLGTVPDVVCANLQDAQNALRLSGFLLLTTSDGTGQGRIAVFDRNWVVTKQSVAAGSRPSLLTHIVLTAVKYGEPTDNPDCQT